MPPEVLPGARWTPGRLAGYARGATRMQINIDHCTAGHNSFNIGLDGYFNILLPKVGAPYQFAETNALTWHAAHMNPYGPGVEIERMSAGSMWRWGLSGWETLTEDQAYWLRAWHEHCLEWGIPAEHFIGPRFEWQGFRGNANHGDVDNQRSDGITDLRLGEATAEWQATAPGTIIKPTEPVKQLPRRDRKMIFCWLVWHGLPPGGLVDVFYNGGWMENFANEGGTADTFWIGPRLRKIIEDGYYVITVDSQEAYEVGGFGQPGLRDRILATAK